MKFVSVQFTAPSLLSLSSRQKDPAVMLFLQLPGRVDAGFAQKSKSVMIYQ